MTTKCTTPASLGCNSHYSAMDLQLHHRDTEKVREDSALSAEGLHMSRMHRSMLSPVRSLSSSGCSSSLTRKNKRKNFQPRNIRPTSAEGSDETAQQADEDVNACDTHDESALCSFNVRTGLFSSSSDHSLSVRNFASLALENAQDSSQSLREDQGLTAARNKKREAPLDLSEGSSPVKRKSTANTSEPEDDSSRDADELLEGNSGSSQGSSRAGSSSRSPSSQAAVMDLSFRPQSDSDDDEEMDSKMSHLISLYTQAAAQQQPFNNKQMADLAESTMRDILGMYGLSREATEFSMASGKFLPPYPIERSTTTVQAAAMPTASAPSQPPTPPHTPKTANTNGRVHEMRGSDPALVALQAHMQSVLRAAGGPAAVSPRSSTPGATLTFSYPLSPAKTAIALTTSMSSRVGNNSAETKSLAVLNNDAHQLHHPATHVSPSGLGVPVIKTAIGGKQLLSSGSRGNGNGEVSKGTPIDYTRYVKRFTSAMECGSPYCKDLNYREHFHCLDCHARVFVKKEEMIRHFKWHKKRDESLQHGFMRYSPMDDCSDRFRGCSHNRKQTHYHCLKEGCDKVYISTSDVQMHANYHRKDSAIIQEGFQRYRATEDCATSYCAFNGQRTTHFHCRRTGCNYTFKNKADMEKHKSYHIKDEQLCRDGFKKFMKNESCNFDNCRFSKVCNHIHCIRAGCTYVLHSSGQLYSHKRKHERRDSELAYRQYRSDGTSFTPDTVGLSGEFPSTGFPMHFNLPLSLADAALAGDLSQQHALMNLPSELQRSALANPSLAFLYGRLPGMFHSLDSTSNGSVPDHAHESTSMDNRSPSPVISEEDAFRLCVKKVEAGKKSCGPSCELSPNEHYHCQAEGCTLSLKYLDAAKEHWRNHEQQEHITDNFFTTVEVAEDPVPCPPTCPYQAQHKHYHCNWENCGEIISASDKPFRRLDHFKMHEYARRGGPGSLPNQTSSKDGSPAAATAFSLDSMFRRKRGRPPKNRFIEVWNESAPSSSGSANSDMPQAIFTSFKLPKPSTPPLSSPSPGTNFFMNPFPTPNLMPLSLTSKPSSADVKPTISPTNSSHSDSAAAGRSEGEAKAPAKSEKSSPRSIPSPSGTQRSESPPRATVVKAAGTFYPIPAFPGKGDPPTEDMQSSSLPSFPPQGNGSPFLPSLVAEKPIAYGPEQSCGRPFCKLKRRDHYHCVVCNQAFSEVERLKPHMLKHCSGALSPNMGQWTSSSEKPKELKDEPEKEIHNGKQEKPEEEVVHRSEGLDTRSFPATPGPSSQSDPFTSISAMTAEVGRPSALHALAFMSRPPYGLIPAPQQGGSPASSFSSFINPDLSNFYGNSGLLLGTHPIAYGAAAAAAAAVTPSSAGGPSPQQPLSPDHLLGSEAKKMRFQSSMRILKDEPVPEGYVRYRFNEDCQYPHCGYREHQTHFHCMRPDCGYSFCDKTRFVQHTARHERLDTLMGGDFQQYRANVSCGRQGCLYTASLGSVQNKASHFHCLKCDFVCTDTNKVVAHRRQHQKTDSILAAGFEKFTPSQSCRVDNCPHSNKQTHYHCLKCCYAVLGLAQMSAHKYRHMD